MGGNSGGGGHLGDGEEEGGGAAGLEDDTVREHEERRLREKVRVAVGRAHAVEDCALCVLEQVRPCMLRELKEATVVGGLAEEDFELLLRTLEVLALGRSVE